MRTRNANAPGLNAFALQMHPSRESNGSSRPERNPFRTGRAHSDHSRTLTSSSKINALDGGVERRSQTAKEIRAYHVFSQGQEQHRQSLTPPPMRAVQINLRASTAMVAASSLSCPQNPPRATCVRASIGATLNSRGWGGQLPSHRRWRRATPSPP